MDRVENDTIMQTINHMDMYMTTMYQGATQQGDVMTFLLHLRSILIGKWSLAFDIPSMFILILTLLAGFGNMVFVWCFFHVPRLRKPFNVCVLGMAISDGLMTTIAAPMELTEILLNFVPIGYVWCDIKLFIRTFCLSSSLILIFTISIFRLLYGAMHFPPKPMLKIMVMILGIIYGLCVGMAMFVVDKTSNVYMQCLGILIANTSLDNPTWKWFLILSLLLFIGTFLSYFVLALIMKFRHSSSSVVQHNLASRNDILTLRTAIIVTTWFAICYLVPFLALFYSLQPSLPDMLHWLALFNTSIYIQSAINPLIYTWSNQVYRAAILNAAPRGIKRFVKALCCLNDVGVEPIIGLNTSANMSNTIRLPTIT